MMKSWIMMMHQTLPLLKAWTTQLGTLWRSGRHVFWCQQAVKSRIGFKLCLLMHLIHTGRAPQCLVNSVQRHLRSSETTDYIKRTIRTKFGDCGFSYSGPAAWNSLPSHLRTMTDINVFKWHLKAFLFTVIFIVLLAPMDNLYSSALQITDCIVLYCIDWAR